MQFARMGRYRIVDLLGRGGMALVYRGHDDELDRPVAIKLLADNLAADESSRRRFLREARLAARLTHPNIVQVYDSGEDGGRPYIVMEYVDGETLGDLLQRQGTLPPAEAIRLALQACAGLAHAHREGLVHRDIKPQNLLLRRDGTLKIADFGIARSAHGTRLTEIGSILGTAAYLAPEQAAGEDVAAPADLYALGVILYQMLTGRTPYTADTLTLLLVRQQEQPIRPVREVAPETPPALEDVVMRCLARIPGYRPPSAAALGGQLRTASSELPTRGLASAGEADTAPTEVAQPLAASPPRARRSGSWAVVVRRVGATAIVVIALVVAILGLRLAGNGPEAGPPPLSPEPAARSPAEQARDFSRWLRASSR